MSAVQRSNKVEWPETWLARIDPTRNMSRFWAAWVEPTLFAEVLLVRNWGRIGTRGQRKSYWFCDQATAGVALAKLVAAKRRRGYAELSDLIG